MESERRNENDENSRFLEEFCKAHPASPQPDSLPFRLKVFYLNEEQLEGECMDWTLEYAEGFECPWILGYQLAWTAAQKVTSQNISDLFETEECDTPPPPSSSNDAEKKDSKENEKADSEGIVWPKLVLKQKNPPRMEAYKVGYVLFHEIRKLCHEWKEKLPELPNLTIKYETVAHSIRNTRRRMEDKHVIIHDLNYLLKVKDAPLTSYYAVFDGHGGIDAACFAAAHLHRTIVQDSRYTTDIMACMLDAYKKIDTDFIEKSLEENMHCGTTGVTAIVRGSKMYVSWLGDSQALLVRNGQPVEIMKPHKPEREDEKKRIEDLGGCVVWFGAWRVNGNLSVSRAIGDHEHKPFVSGDPDMIEIDLEGNEDYLVLACDGLWDTLMPDNVVEVVQEHLSEKKGDCSEIAQTLIKAAKKKKVPTATLR